MLHGFVGACSLVYDLFKLPRIRERDAGSASTSHQILVPIEMCTNAPNFNFQLTFDDLYLISKISTSRPFS